MRALICMLLLATLALALAPQNIAKAKVELTVNGEARTVETDALAVRITTDPAFPLAPAQERYVSPTQKIQSNDSQIAALAGQVVEGCAKELEAVVAIVGWVHDNIEYAPAEYSGVFSATQVLKMRKGMCGEFAVLAAAMLRSQGIPAKYVRGHIYTGSGFQPHSWLRVYVPGTGWIQADPTLGQVGLVDAGHVKLAEGEDPSDTPAVHENETELRLVESEAFSDLFTASLSASSSLRHGETGNATLTLTNLRDYYLVPSIRLGHDSGLVVEKPFTMAVVPPSSKAEVTWEITPGAGDRGSYNYSLQAKGPDISEAAEVAVTLEKDVLPEARMEIVSFKKTLLKDVIILTAEVANTGDADMDVEVSVHSTVHEAQTETVALVSGSRKSLSFAFSTVTGVDSYKFTLEASGGGLKFSEPLYVELQKPLPEEPLEELGRSVGRNMDQIFLIAAAVVLCGVGFFFLSPYVLRSKKPFASGKHYAKAEHKLGARPFEKHHKKQVMGESWKMLGKER